MDNELHKILKEVLEKVKPTERDLRNVMEFSNRLMSSVERILKESLNYDFKVTLEGSVAKGTWLRNDVDLDIFVLIKFDNLNKEWLEENFIKPLIGKLKNKYSVILKYAQHPYLTVCSDLCADIVPAFWASKATEARTVVDRTPFHTEYIERSLSEEQKDEVRLLKLFFKGIGIYGAEVKVKGFSGYLTELLIAYYGSFLNAVSNIAEWEPPLLIDIGKHCKDASKCLKKFRNNPLVVIDPVDPRRNVAAAVSIKSLSTAILACREFLKKPSIKYFFPETKALRWEDITNFISKRGTCLIGLLIKTYEVPPDNAWGYFRSTEDKLVNGLRKLGFTVIDSDTWYDEKENAIILFEVIPKELPLVKLIEGPPIKFKEHCIRFMNKHPFNRNLMAGVWISKEGKLLALDINKYNKPKTALEKLIKSIKIHRGIVRDLRIIDNLNKLISFYNNFEGFKRWISKFVVKTPY